jgi:putative ABC transport system permease protein
MLSALRYVSRSLGRAKGFTLATVLTLALGIGSAAAIFSVVEWVLFDARSYSRDLYLAGAKDKEGESSPFLFDAELRAYQTQTNVVSEWGFAVSRSVNVALGGYPVATMTLDVSKNLLGMLGVVPVHGRGFAAGEDVEGRNDVVVISDRFRKQHFGGVDDVLGYKISVDQRVCTIVGVLKEDQMMPPYFGSDVYRPLAYRVDPETPWDPILWVVARLRPGASPLKAQEVLAGAKADLPAKSAAMLRGRAPLLTPLADLERMYRPETYWMLLGAVGFLYSIACLNATNLMLVRMLGKRREVSIRLALGCGHWRVIGLFAAESLGLSLAASAAGVLFANWLVPLFLALADVREDVNRWTEWSLDGRTIAVLGTLTIATGLGIAVVPSLRISRLNILAGLRDGGGALGESRRLARIRGTFVVIQAAFAVILLTGAGLMVRTFQRLQDVNLGFDASHRVKVQLGFPSGYVTGKDQRLQLLHRLRDHLLRVPGVVAVGFGTDNLMTGYEYAPSELQLADGTSVKVKMDEVSPDYLEASGMVLKRGRWCDATGAEVMVNESFARVRYGREDPIGKLLKPLDAKKGWGGWLVVGVVADVRETVQTKPGLHVYGPETWYPPNMTSFIVKMARDPGEEAAGVLRRAIYQFDPKIVTADAVALTETRNRQLYHERFATSVLKVLSAIAMLLTLVGFFSVLAYSVDQRMAEFGVRIAMGATPRDLVILVMRRGLLLASLGIACGIAGAMVLARYLRSLLFETPQYDPVVLAAVAGMLAAAAFAACLLPALRASRADVSGLLKSN